MSDLRAAVAAGALGSEESYRELLQSIVEVARAIFGARASSVFLHDEESDELVFEAVAGEGAGDLVGQRFPSSTGIAGWVLVTRQPLVVDELDKDPRFAREAAESTGFVPKGPDGRPAAARGSGTRRARGARPAAARPRSRWRRWSFSACSRTRPRSRSTCCRRPARPGPCWRSEGGDAEALARFAARLDEAEPDKREAALQLLDALGKLLRER